MILGSAGGGISAHAELTEFKIVADDPTGGDHFGRAMAISGDRVVVGAMTSGNGQGAVYVYERSGEAWLLDEKLLPSAGSYFGRSVAIDGDYLAVGQLGGRGTIYRRDVGGWTEQVFLNRVSDGFGTAAAISGDLALFGADSDDEAGSDVGAAFVYRREGETWVQEAKLMPSDGQPGDSFGFSADLSGDYAVVGAWNALAQQGAAYVFERQIDGSWIEAARLTADDGAPGDQLGAWFIGIDGAYAVVGALNDDDLGNNSGSAYVFNRGADGEWSQQAKLVASNGQSGAQFGVSTAISGDFALIGSFDDAYAYLFRRDGTSWNEVYAFSSSDYETGDDFGYALDIDGAYAAVGADDDYNGGIETGSAYVFSGYAESAVAVGDIPDQTVIDGDAFSPIALDDFVSHPDYLDDEIGWMASGQTALAVDIDGARVATVTAPSGWLGAETITFEATAPDGSADSDAATYAVTEPGPPVVSDIPDQTITEGDAFATVVLDDFVTHATYADDEITWTASGQVALAVEIDGNRIATVTALLGWTGAETITFEATAPDGGMASDAATFSVEEPVAGPPTNLTVTIVDAVATLTWEGEATDVSCTSLTDTVTGSSYTIRFPEDVAFFEPQICTVSNASGESNPTGRFGCFSADNCRVN